MIALHGRGSGGQPRPYTSSSNPGSYRRRFTSAGLPIRLLPPRTAFRLRSRPRSNGSPRSLCCRSPGCGAATAASRPAPLAANRALCGRDPCDPRDGRIGSLEIRGCGVGFAAEMILRPADRHPEADFTVSRIQRGVPFHPRVPSRVSERAWPHGERS